MRQNKRWNNHQIQFGFEPRTYFITDWHYYLNNCVHFLMSCWLSSRIHLVTSHQSSGQCCPLGSDEEIVASAAGCPCSPLTAQTDREDTVCYRMTPSASEATTGEGANYKSLLVSNNYSQKVKIFSQGCNINYKQRLEFLLFLTSVVRGWQNCFQDCWIWTVSWINNN